MDNQNNKIFKKMQTVKKTKNKQMDQTKILNNQMKMNQMDNKFNLKMNKGRIKTKMKMVKINNQIGMMLNKSKEMNKKSSKNLKKLS